MEETHRARLRREHIERLTRTGRGQIYSTRGPVAVTVLEYDAETDRFRVRFNSTGAVDSLPRRWVYARPAEGGES